MLACFLNKNNKVWVFQINKGKTSKLVKKQTLYLDKCTFIKIRRFNHIFIHSHINTRIPSVNSLIEIKEIFKLSNAIRVSRNDTAYLVLSYCLTSFLSHKQSPMISSPGDGAPHPSLDRRIHLPQCQASWHYSCLRKLT